MRSRYDRLVLRRIALRAGFVLSPEYHVGRGSLSSEPWNKCGRLSKTKERIRFIPFFEAFLCPFLLGWHSDFCQLSFSNFFHHILLAIHILHFCLFGNNLLPLLLLLCNFSLQCTFVNDVRLKNRKNKEKSQNTLRGGEERWSEAKPNGDDTQCL